MKLMVTIAIVDDDLADGLDPKRFKRTLQDAMDSHWSMERMGLVRIDDVRVELPVAVVLPAGAHPTQK